MKVPRGGSHPYNRFCRWIFAIYKVAAIQYGLAPVVLGFPPVLVTSFYSNKTTARFIEQHVPFFAEILNQHSGVMTLAAFLYPFLILGFAKSVVTRVDARGLNVDGLLALMATLDEVVGCKNGRFAKHAKDTKKLTKENAFCAITQPQIQMAELIRGICNLFNAIRTSKNRNLIKVTMAVIENGQVVSIPIYYPQDEPVLADISALNKPGSAIITACKTKKTVVIDSITSELRKPDKKRRFVDAGNERDNTGSLICFPVMHHETRTIPYVISIHCDEDNYFKNEFSELYEHSLQRFALRLSLEHSLFLIKEELCESR